MAGPPRGRRSFLGALGGMALGAVAGCVAPVGTQTATTEVGTRSPTTPVETGTAASATSPYARIYRETVDSVVLVQVAGPALGGQGSGFVFDDAGHVLTNDHVVADGDRIDLRFADGEWRSATVLGTDGYSDLAVLEVEDRPDYATRLPLVEAAPDIGAEVVAIGSPFGLEESLSVGIVSGVHRAIPTRGGFSIPDAVQTDAAVNPGNSGGPLVTLDGRVVGVIRSGGGDNIGFAVSAALIERVAPALVDRGRYFHPFLGVSILDVTPTVADANDLDRATGVLIVDVVGEGPSDGTLRGGDGTRQIDGVDVPVGGDVIVALDGEPVPSSGVLGRFLALETSPDEVIAVGVIRDGERTTVDVELGVRPSA